MVTIYQRCFDGRLEVFPYTREGQFNSHAAAERYLNRLNRPYNGSCTIITQCSYEKATRLYGGI